MKRVFEATVFRAPCPQPRLRTRRNGPSYLPDDHPIHAFKAAVRAAAERVLRGRSPTAGPVTIELEFVMKPARSVGYCPGGPVTQKSRGDGDNLEKAVWDALSGILYGDDCQIWKWSGVKRWVNRDEEPHVRITAKWDEPGRIP